VKLRIFLLLAGEHKHYQQRVVLFLVTELREFQIVRHFQKQIKSAGNPPATIIDNEVCVATKDHRSQEGNVLAL